MKDGVVRVRSPESEVQGIYCPLMPASLLAKRLASGKCVLTETGLEKHCSKCDSYWPMDTEFWFSNRGETDGLYQWCRACYVAHRWPDGRRSDPRGATVEVAA